MEFQLQYISDIHLEFRKDYTIKPIAPNLALCGDIGWPDTCEYHNFISQVSKLFKNVFVIFGNHEYYNKCSSNSNLSMIQKRKFTVHFPKNVYFLNNNCIYLNLTNNQVYHTYQENCIKIIGSTLWTNINAQTSKLMNDYNYIYFTKKCTLQRKHVLHLYNKSKEYIIKEIEKEPNIKCILLTHHGSHPVFFGYNRHSDLFSAYTNNIPDLYKQKNLIACFSGHSHYSINKKIYFHEHEIYFMSNQLGYPFEKESSTKFNENRVFNYHFTN